MVFVSVLELKGEYPYGNEPVFTDTNDEVRIGLSRLNSLARETFNPNSKSQVLVRELGHRAVSDWVLRGVEPADAQKTFSDGSSYSTEATRLRRSVRGGQMTLKDALLTADLFREVFLFKGIGVALYPGMHCQQLAVAGDVTVDAIAPACSPNCAVVIRAAERRRFPLQIYLDFSPWLPFRHPSSIGYVLPGSTSGGRYDPALFEKGGIWDANSRIQNRVCTIRLNPR